MNEHKKLNLLEEMQLRWLNLLEDIRTGSIEVVRVDDDSFRLAKEQPSANQQVEVYNSEKVEP